MLTTSYPRRPGDPAGAFVADAVDAVRGRGVDVAVVSPASFQHFGIAYGHGVLGNLRAAPWKALLLPAFLASFAFAARRATRGADVVHAHWLPSGAIALMTGRPVIVQLWGTDVELARRAPWIARALLRQARLVVCASSALAAEAERLGAREVRLIPTGVVVPERVAEPDEPAHVLFVGRLSPEKGILEFLAATEGMPRVIVGDGPLRERVPEAVGFVPHDELGRYYERAAVVACPSRREGYGVVAREAMAHGRPVVASAVGGLTDAVEDGVSGLLVPSRDVRALRAAVEGLLGDATMRRRLGEGARERALQQFAGDAAASQLIDAYAAAVEERRSPSRTSTAA